MEIAAREKQAVIFSKEEILAFEGGIGSFSTGDSFQTMNPFGSRVSVVLKDTHEFNEKAEHVTICCLPLQSTDGRVMGVMELESKFRVTPEDLKLLECFASFAAVSLEREQLKEIADFGKIESRLKEWITAGETGVGPIPEKLKIPANRVPQLLAIGFNVEEWDTFGFFGILFEIFERFQLLSEFRISNAKFYRFLEHISLAYNPLPFPNWGHAVNVAQFVSNEVVVGELQGVFTKLELAALLVAALCHDANHDGFSKTSVTQEATPIGILFKKQSVMETNHCLTSIHVLSREECNILDALSPVEQKEAWNLIINLILITDMAKHFSFLTEVNHRLEEGPLFHNNPDERALLMQLLLKCADLCDLARPRGIDKLCNCLCEEFFKQGDIDNTPEMAFTSPDKDRANIDKENSERAVYQYVCLPLFETTARACPPLQANVVQLKKNMQRWPGT
jgi:hypothetical protein